MLSARSDQVASAYDLGRPDGELAAAARGEQGRIWRLDTDSGTYAVKELLVRQTEAAAAADVAFQEAALAAGAIPMPVPRRTPQGRVLSELGAHQVRVYDWVDLLPADEGQDPALIGRTYAAVHRVQHPGGGPLVGWFTDPVGAQAWSALLAAAEAVRAPFAEELAAEIPHLVALEALLETPTELQTCHRDLWSDNVLPVPSGGVCVIDWENCGLASPAQELPMALVDFCSGDEDRTRAFYAAYVDAGGPARLHGRADFTMVIAQFGHFWQVAVEEYLAPESSETDRAHSLERIAMCTATPLRVEHVDATLDWVASEGSD